MRATPFRVGQRYTRQRVQEILQVPEERRGGNWDTGYTSFNGAHYIFCNVGTPGRTGHDHGNHWVGDELRWSAKSRSRLSHPSIQALTSGDHPVHVFWRDDDRKPFYYAGTGRATNVVDTSPVHLIWVFELPDESSPVWLASDVRFIEGTVKPVLVNAYERNPHARARCIEHYGLNCSICAFNFEDAYGEVGKDYIHIHHLNELSLMGGQHELEPIRDLVPVCANCHAILHRRRPAYSIEEARLMLRRLDAHR